MIVTLLTLHIIVTLSLTGIILLQRSEGGALGIGGSPGSMFTGQQSTNVLTRITTVLAVAFFSLAIAIAVLSSQERSSNQAPPSLFAPTDPAGSEFQIPVLTDGEKPSPSDSVAPQQSAPLTPTLDGKDTSPNAQ